MILRGGGYTTDFTEFTFGYALTRSVEANLPSVAAVPSFPSLLEEGQTGGGYDVRIERAIAPLFLQFKIPRVIVKPTSRTTEQGLLAAPYYRMYLHARGASDQHLLLLELAKESAGVFYATPEFDDKATIDTRHMALSVGEATAFFHPEDIGPLADDDEHYIAYEADETSGWLCSEPKKVNTHRYSHLARITDRLAGQGRTEDFYERLMRTYYIVVERAGRSDLLHLIDTGANSAATPTAASRASYLSQVIFDCQLLVVYEPED